MSGPPVVNMPDWLYDDLWKLAELPLEDVKIIWDAYDGTNSPFGFFDIAIHMTLNFRGHGDYCAV